MNFGVRLQRVLDEIGMSQSELGRRIGATSQSVNGWCQAGILPRKEMLEQLPDITGKPLYWFFMTDEDEETLQPPRSEDIYVLTPETKKAHRNLRSASSSGARTIRRVNAVKAGRTRCFHERIFNETKERLEQRYPHFISAAFGRFFCACSHLTSNSEI
ncbi:helix-turn-helix domain-containing protein [Klebsiella variicola subsp. variicola]|nr:helix-turn-helix domain-containing protein [Klebsiella variicola subsp. variicola]